MPVIVEITDFPTSPVEITGSPTSPFEHPGEPSEEPTSPFEHPGEPSEEPTAVPTTPNPTVVPTEEEICGDGQGKLKVSKRGDGYRKMETAPKVGSTCECKELCDSQEIPYPMWTYGMKDGKCQCYDGKKAKMKKQKECKVGSKRKCKVYKTMVEDGKPSKD